MNLLRHFDTTKTTTANKQSNTKAKPCTYLVAWWMFLLTRYSGVTMGAMASQLTSLTIVYSTVYSCADQRKHQSSTSLAVVRGIHRWPVNSSHKESVTRNMFPFDDVMTWERIPRYWPFVKEIYRLPVVPSNVGFDVFFDVYRHKERGNQTIEWSVNWAAPMPQ